ncbi:MAG: alpha/beta hydrolase [Ilumatobacteraceae bacterium]|jgi:pimeloyl-ACP methyl ester carboxylesterase|nr:alpha/beta hydrolase [Ilumatobacteraceae bacterium]MDP4702621.1 alpha/beta hydrolase [Ilumatobacteraceae bacterium]MDP5109747.1 alpha/beta hydrolase [Ilumatobacteraceae bacterium]
MQRVPYDEFSLFHENIAEYSLTASAQPQVQRIAHQLGDGRTVSALKWGSAEPQMVFVHGGSQNAHTWDTVLLDLGVPALAIDLPGHGHSSWRDDAMYSPHSMAVDIAEVIALHAASAKVVVGMSLGGLTSLALAGHAPHLVQELVLVDITPGVNGDKAKAILDFVNGPQAFASFDDLLKRTIEHNPTRTTESLRRGILHNAKQLDDGSWQWRYDRRSHIRSENTEPISGDALGKLWDLIGALNCPLTLLRGGTSPVVDDADVAELKRRQGRANVLVIDGAGHSIQGDKPRELAAFLATKSV